MDSENRILFNEVVAEVKKNLNCLKHNYDSEHFEHKYYGTIKKGKLNGYKIEIKGVYSESIQCNINFLEISHGKTEIKFDSLYSDNHDFAPYAHETLELLMKKTSKIIERREKRAQINFEKEAKLEEIQNKKRVKNLEKLLR